jgi:hypothetical protein
MGRKASKAKKPGNDQTVRGALNELADSLSPGAGEALRDAAAHPHRISRAGVFRRRVYKTVEPDTHRA